MPRSRSACWLAGMKDALTADFLTGFPECTLTSLESSLHSGMRARFPASFQPILPPGPRRRSSHVRRGAVVA